VFEAIAHALGVVIIPVAIVLLVVSGLSETKWMIAKVASLVLVTAPLSSLVSLVLAVLILREGP